MERENLRLRDYVMVVLKRKRLIVAGTLISAVTAAVVSLVLPNIYEAKATLLITWPNVKTDLVPPAMSIGISQTPAPEPQQPQFRAILAGTGVSVKTCQTLLKSHDLLREIIDRLELEDITVEELDEEILSAEIIEEMKTYYTVRHLPLVNLIVRIRDKEMARDIANTWADLFVEKIEIITAIDMDDLYQFTAGELKDSREKLFISEAALTDFKKKSGLPLLEIELEDRKERLKTAREEKALKDIITEREKEVAALQGIIYDRELELNRLERDLRASKMSYDLFLQKHEQAKIAKKERIPKVKMVARAIKPEEQVAPQRGKIVSIAAMLGFVAMTLAAFAVEASKKA